MCCLCFCRRRTVVDIRCSPISVAIQLVSRDVSYFSLSFSGMNLLSNGFNSLFEEAQEKLPESQIIHRGFAVNNMLTRFIFQKMNGQICSQLPGWYCAPFWNNQ